MIKSKGINIYNLYFCLILLLPLTTLFQSYIDFINRVVFLVIFLLQVVIVLQSLKKRQLIVLFVAFISLIFAIFATDNFSFNNSVVYFTNFIIYVTVFLNDKQRFFKFIKSNESYIKAIIWIWTLFIIISIPLSSSYYIKEGGEQYFGSFAGDIFRLAPTAVFISILSIIAIVFYKNKKYICFQIIPLYCGLMGSSRTYFGCLCILFVIALYYFFDKRRYFYVGCIIFLLLGAYVFLDSAIYSKIDYTLDDSQYGDFWFRVTNSRSVIWSNIISGYSQLDFIGKLFGGGFGFSNSVAMGHYSHNDFLEILVTFGLLGLILYLVSIFMLFKNFYKKGISSKFIVLLILLIWLFNAMFNMFYSYTCTAMSLPFLLAILDVKKENCFVGEMDHIKYEKSSAERIC